MATQPLPASMAAEGELMIAALLEDIRAAGHKDITVFRDARLPPLEHAVEQIRIDASRQQQIHESIQKDDIVWLIAPETDHVLGDLANAFLTSGGQLMGCSPDSIRLTSSKTATWKCLNENGIDTVTCTTSDEVLPGSETGWVVKPDDGAGAEDTYHFQDKDELTHYLSQDFETQRIVQPYVAGEPLSLSLLCFQGDVSLLACNRQYIERTADGFTLTAIGVNEIIDDGRLQSLAKQLAAAVPGLAGYVGVDLIRTNNRDWVLEINPRLTTAYAGISQSIGINIAEMILSTFLEQRLPDIDVSAARPVRIVV